MMYTHSRKEPIAIIGTGCRLPGNATNPSKLWELLYSPRDLSKPIPPEARFNAEGYYHQDGERHGCSNVKNAYVLEEDPRLFDAGFFGISPREAEAMDPQQRLLLETVYEAMENAGLSLEALRGSDTSAYVGAMTADYTDTQVRDHDNQSQYMITGTSRAILSNRLSYVFDWRGPSIAVDTACSSSLVAVHMGVQSLRNGECTLSCVAGSNVILGPDVFLMATSLHLLSPTGKSQMWDQAADGYARGEGVCVFFLKTLSQALRDGDRIDALIRESAINSDGRTKGIALPSAQAQAALIRRAYENSGLDMLRVEDRPQYIEAHGTGTQAGDPIEASALSQSLFPPGHEEKNHPPIFVGSIKTIIGHTEGCAGIAGILKALLAMQHKIIPPNQHFHNLNPNIKPYYGNLQIATRPRQWPPVPSRQPLRASINGFGSGGTNCHVILETYVPEVHDHGPWGKAVAKRNVPAPTLPDTDFTPIPLVFSAISDPALSVMVKRYADHLQQTDVPLQSLAMTLHSHRSLFPARIAFTGTSKMAIVQAMNKELTKLSQSLGAEIGTRVPAIEFDENRRPRIIGIFTGQGAQWAGMGQDLIKRNTLFRKTVEDMETSLGALPDPPAWSLKDELMAPPAESRLSEAEISLPLCTAVQVGLTRLLSAAGITFHTVVGHSGGEVAAAYAAGKISASAAVAISYYRGVYVKLASRLDEKAGKMIAVGFGYDEGMKFCSSPSMEGRLCVGASNSPKSVTLSGDEDAVLEAKAIFDKDGLFNRVLKVDKAYHSPHVYPAGQPYIDALESCNIAAGQGNGTTHWVSSVYDDMRTMDSTEDEELRANYWKENLVRTVLFSQAVERAVDDGRGSLDLILEVGPHPALKGPTLETIRSKLGSEVPYSGVLDRKAEDVTAFSKALGFVWTHLGPACVDFGGFLSSFDDSEGKLNTKPLPNLPSYPWDHKQILWKESRYNKQIRLRTEGPHELLGSRTGDDTDFEPRWRNYLKLDEIPWLQDHIIQNQIITPAATYCVMALEAAKVLCKGKSVKSIELRNIDIMRPIILDEASEGAEILLSLRSDLDSNSKSRADLIHADFSLSSGMIEDHHLRTCATGEIRIVLASDEPATVDFSATRPTAPRAELLPVNVNQFYESLGAIGLDYRNSFRALTKLERRLDMASAVVSIDETAKSLVVHPTWLDACFQTFFAAFASPQDGSLSTPFMPTTISRMVFSPTLSSNRQDRPGSFTTDTQINSITPGYQTTLPKLAGDINVYDCKTGKLELRIEDFTMSSFLPATEKDDRSLYLSIVMKQDILSGALFDVMEPMIAPRDRRVIDACERVVDHYLSVLGADERLEDVAGTSPALKGLVRQAAYRGSRAVTPAELSSIFEEFGDHPDLVLVKTIGDKILGHSKSSTPEDGASLADMITRWHNVGLGFTEIHSHIVSVARQIAHKHAHLRILQVGPSSAKLVRDVYHALGNAVSSYVIADESPEALNTMGEELLPDGVGVDIKQFDFEHQTQEIGSVFGETSFDLVIAHKAFIKQPAALRTVRSLMRPGAFLLMMAATGRQLRFPFFLLSGSPPVMADDETAQPQIGNPTREEVHSLLQRCGFSGVDSMALDNVWEKHTFSLAVSQAVDDHIRFMRAPLSLPPPSAATRGKLLLLGGSSSKIATVVQAIRTTLGTTWRGEVVGIESLDVLTPDQVNGVEIAVSLADLDGPVLDGMSLSAFKNLQLFLKGPKVVLWVTQGARSDSPYQNGTIGLMRSFQSENPQRVVQLLDVDATESAATIVAESLLRLDAGVICGEGETGESRLWVVEPELVVQHGKYLIPRVMPDRERNDRLNALRRKVEIQTSLETQPVTLLRSLRDSGEVVYAAHEAPQERSRLAVLRSGEDQITLRIEYCSTYPVLPNRNSPPLFACIGRTAQGVRYLALSSTNSSVITIPLSYVIEMDDDSFRDSAAIPVLSHVLHEIQARLIDHNLPTDWLVLLYEADPQLVTAIGEGSIQFSNDVKLVSHHSLPSGHIEVKPAISLKELASMIPTNTRLLIDMARHSSARQLAAVRQALPRSVPVVSFSDLSSDGLVPQEVLARALVSANTHCSSSGLALDSDCVLPASVAIDTKSPGRTSATIIDWTGNQTITLHRVPVDPHHLFSPAKTYLLFGLSGQIGQSMCRWMFANGVRHLVVTSRNPDKNAAWKIELEEQGAQILLESADVAKKQDLVDLRNRVVAFMPPIGGVANGAMVLADQNFADMSYEAFADSQRPKVEGSKNLEEVFSRDALDFFLMFSSISAVTGQRFQANYAAANNFMVGLAAQMRTRNVPAAVIDIGMVIGIGVVSAATAADGSNAMMAALRKVDYMPVSERDLHHLLAEGILAARSSGPFEITTGLEVYSTTGNQPFWHKNPLFSHLIANTKSSKVGKVSGDSAQKPLREKLEGAVGPDDRIRTMEEAFMAYLESSLKLPSKSIYTDLPLIDLGIDSLVAVEIRNWISVETGHDIPVLKILGGSSIKQICTDVAASFQGSKPNATETQPQPHVTPSPTTEVKSSEAKGPEVDSSLSPPLRPISRPSSAECSLASRSSDTDATSGISLSKPPLPATYRTAPLSRGQSRLYFLAQYLEDVTVLNCTISYRLSGPLDAVKLEKSLEAASNRHETLRTIFYTDELSGQPVQGVMDRSRFKLKTSPGFDDPTGEKEFDMLHQYHYDLEQGDTFHATLLSHGADSHTIIFAYHHIVMDGVSWQVFLQDLSAFYNDPSSVISPPPLPTQYIDFTLKQQRDLSAGAYTERLEFFKDQFSRPVDPLPLFPFAKVSTRKSATSYRVRDIVRHIDTGLLSAMKKRSQESRTTSSHFFFAALQIMLHRLLDIEEICIGMVDANRSDQSFGNTIGFFLETLPILFQVDGRQKFSDVLQATRIKAYKALSQTGVPMEEILRACNISASATETPLFQVVFNYRMGAGRTSSLQGVDMEYLAYADAKHTFDLVVSVDELPDGTAMITLSVQDYLYDQEGADLLIDTYIHLLRELSRDTSQTVGSVPVFNNDLAKHAVALGTGVRLEPPPRSVGTLSKMIHAWVESDPEGLAVKDGQGRTRTYRGLSQRAAAISATLLGERIRPGSPVSVFLDPEVDTIATILGILQIGATYVPLDIRNTDEAVADIQQECGATLMIYHSATGQRAREIQNLLTSPEQVRMISLDMIAPEAVPEIEDVSTPEGVAMILYTSGSTGKPKGIPLTHGNLRTTIIGVTERVGLGREVMLQQCCQGFDSAIFQIFNCLANGGTLIIADNRCDPAELAQLMAREGVTCGLFIVSEMQSMLKYGYEALGRCSSWRIAMVAGEAFTANLLDQFRSLKRPDLKIVNTYGPTEAAICSSQYEILPDDSVITIGKPLANYGVYIVDEECNPVPVGWPGELVICGPGIASGYIDLPELTRAKFRNHVFEGAPPEWDRAYLTGDRGRMMSDGSILVSGRMNGDGEVKIRGMRVQLDDVARELVYASKGNLVDAAILVRGGGAENQNLIAFVVFASTSDVESKEVYLRRLIQELPIPRYMRPTIAVPLDTLPVTGRGKLDRRKLAAVPLPQLSGTGTDDEELTEAEIRLRRVWRAALGDISSSVQIRRSSDFFSVGGNSLLLIPLRLEIRRVFAVDISIPELFQTSTLELMAARLSGKSQEVNIDWEEETQLDDAFLATLPRTMIDTAPVSELSVLLTGATGFLGTALLRELVRLPNVAHIHCVAVRANPQNGHRRLGVESPKIIQYPGDLALPYLGMEEADLTVLFKKVHFVIHNGAEVSHMKNYRSLRDSNFISTITLTRLAAQRQIPIHYVSTGGVARLSGAVVQPESSLEAFKPPADGSDGYVASKWASEVFLEKVHRHSHGQGIWIHRPSNITGDDVPALDIVHSVLRFSKLLRAVPSLKGSTGAFDFIHVDSVAKDIAWHVLTSRDEKGATPAAPLCYVHHSGEEVVPVDQLRNYIAASVAGPVKTLSLKDWVASAVEQGLDEVVASFLLASNGVIRVPVLQRTRR